jgi:hypothetical protein
MPVGLIDFGFGITRRGSGINSSGDARAYNMAGKSNWSWSK